MNYITIVPFNDLQDKESNKKGHRYEVGDIYPREGLKPTKKRISELSSEKNKRKIALIKEVD